MFRLTIGFAVGAALVFGAPYFWRPCGNEDGPAPCYWDASHRGNHQGTSFIKVTDDWIIHLS